MNPLVEIQNPSRYCGGEFQYGVKNDNAPIHAAICFPDLYEIGMSNNAIRIIYDLLNRMDNVYADHVFSVAPDYEAFLRQEEKLLTTINKGLPLKDLDFLGFSIGYELSATNVLQVLELGGIPIRASDRTDNHPIVIAGGPAVTNPLPFSRFFDFVYIGEAENGLQDVLNSIADAKMKGKGRSEIIESLQAYSFLWYQGCKKAHRAVDTSFGKKTPEETIFKHFIVPNFKVVQDHGTVEIMRGCPNGCRFCHASQYYKPYRQKPIETIAAEVRQYVNDFGYREITLSSLSSGDYPNLGGLIKRLNTEFSPQHVSFSLPSLKVSSFSLDILEQLSEVRKSGLTFAIETPLPEWQRAMNKEVSSQQIITILREAKSRGWKLAKFYFMVGLPFVDYTLEQDAIVTFLRDIHKATGMNMNINIGTFIPKAHTPFQWCEQLNPEAAFIHLRNIKQAIQKEIRGAKISYHEPFISYLEGIISRGGEEVANIIELAYTKGSRLDAWDEYFKKNLWEEAILESGVDTSFLFQGFSLEAPLEWDSVSMNVSSAFLKREYLRAKDSLLTSRCISECNEPCGVCTKNIKVLEQQKTEEEQQITRSSIPVQKQNSESTQVVINYKKTGRAVYVSHINVVRHFEQAFQRAGIQIKYTQGFNPKPKMEFANPLSIGMYGLGELLLAELEYEGELNLTHVRSELQGALPPDFIVNKIARVQSDKLISLAPHMQGSIFTITNIEDEAIRQKLCDQVGRHDYGEVEQCGADFTIKMNGEKNLIKSVFGPDANKFAICAQCAITRKEVLLSGISLLP